MHKKLKIKSNQAPNQTKDIIERLPLTERIAALKKLKNN